MRLGIESLKHDLATKTKEEMAEQLTSYIPGIEHRWFGRPVEPLTKEELLDHWNGGPEPELRYTDVPDYTPSRYLLAYKARIADITMSPEPVAK